MCDRWFGDFVDSVRVLGLLDDTMIILTSDHGRSIGDRDYMGKRGYPSSPEVYQVPLFIRFPGARHAGRSSDHFVQHHDIAAVILEAAEVTPPDEFDCVTFLDDALRAGNWRRNHVAGGWASVVTDRWWLNCKVDGTGVILHDLEAAMPSAHNVADQNADAVQALFSQAEQDAGGAFPNCLLDLARNQANAPGGSALTARKPRREMRFQ